MPIDLDAIVAKVAAAPQRQAPGRRPSGPLNLDAIVARVASGAPQRQATTVLEQLGLRAWTPPRDSTVKLVLDGRTVTIERRDLRALWRGTSKDPTRYGLNGIGWHQTPPKLGAWIDGTRYPSVLVVTDGWRLAALGLRAKPPPRPLFFTVDQLDSLKPWARTAQTAQARLVSGNGELPDFERAVPARRQQVFALDFNPSACQVLESLRTDRRPLVPRNAKVDHRGSSPFVAPAVVDERGLWLPDVARYASQPTNIARLDLPRVFVPGVEGEVPEAGRVGFNPYMLGELAQWWRASRRTGMVLRGGGPLTPWVAVEEPQRFAILMPMVLR